MVSDPNIEYGYRTENSLCALFFIIVPRKQIFFTFFFNIDTFDSVKRLGSRSNLLQILGSGFTTSKETKREKGGGGVTYGCEGGVAGKMRGTGSEGGGLFFA